MKPGTYYLSADGVLKPLIPGQPPPPGAQLVSVKSTTPQQPPPKPNAARVSAIMPKFA